MVFCFIDRVRDVLNIKSVLGGLNMSDKVMRCPNCEGKVTHWICEDCKLIRGLQNEREN